MIIFNNVTKVFGLTAALSNVSLKFVKGCNGLLGPNGAGKTTCLRLSAGFIKPDHGTVTVCEENPFNNPRILNIIGYCPEFDEPFPWMSGRKYLMKILRFYNMSSVEKIDRFNLVMEMFGLKSFIDRAIGGYSRGMKQRLKLAQAVIHDPEILLLDEPLVGLDPIWRIKMIDFIKEWRREDKIIVYSTHLLFDAEKVCNNVFFLYKGALVASGEIYELRERLDEFPHRVEIVVKDGISKVLKNLIDESFINEIIIKERKNDSGVLEIKTNQPSKFYTLIPKILYELDVSVEKIESIDDNLESLYRYILSISLGVNKLENR